MTCVAIAVYSRCMNAFLPSLILIETDELKPSSSSVSSVLSQAINTHNTQSGWRASLRLGFSRDGQTTRLTQRSHNGPLRVQKALYPEGEAVCHVLVLHPPGGVVGGDALAIDIDVGAASHALISNPGAAKWYKANAKISRQSLRFKVADHACLEWMPQESIFYDQVQVILEQEIDLAPNATCILCDIQCFGRTASGEQFEQGRIRQRVQVKRDGQLLWFEQGVIAAQNASTSTSTNTVTSSNMQSPFGLRGHSVNASLLGVGQSVSAAVIKTLREAAQGILHANEEFGVTQMKQVVSVRYLGDSSERARQLMLLAWQILRPAIAGREAVDLRIWRT